MVTRRSVLGTLLALLPSLGLTRLKKQTSVTTAWACDNCGQPALERVFEEVTSYTTSGWRSFQPSSYCKSCLHAKGLYYKAGTEFQTPPNTKVYCNDKDVTGIGYECLAGPKGWVRCYDYNYEQNQKPKSYMLWGPVTVVTVLSGPTSKGKYLGRTVAL